MALLGPARAESLYQAGRELAQLGVHASRLVGVARELSPASSYGAVQHATRVASGASRQAHHAVSILGEAQLRPASIDMVRAAVAELDAMPITPAAVQDVGVALRVAVERAQHGNAVAISEGRAEHARHLLELGSSMRSSIQADAVEELIGMEPVRRLLDRAIFESDVARIAGRTDAQVTAIDRRRLALIRGLPEQLRPHLPDAVPGFADSRLKSDSVASPALRAELASLREHVARQRLPRPVWSDTTAVARELERIAAGGAPTEVDFVVLRNAGAMPVTERLQELARGHVDRIMSAPASKVTQQDVDVLAWIEQLTDGAGLLRSPSASGVSFVQLRSMWSDASARPQIHGAIADVRRDHVLRSILGDAETSIDSVAASLESFISSWDPSPQDIDRLEAILRLPPELLPLDGPRAARIADRVLTQLTKLVSKPAVTDDDLQRLEHLRMLPDALQPSQGLKQVRDAIVRHLEREAFDHAVGRPSTVAGARVLQLIDRMPDAVRSELPAGPVAQLAGKLPSYDLWRMLQSPARIQSVVADLRIGTPMPLATLGHIVDDATGVWSRAGVTRADVLGHVAEELGAVSATSADPRAIIRVAQRALKTIDTAGDAADDTVRAVAEQAARLLDESDPGRRYVEHGALGGAASSVELLAQLLRDADQQAARSRTGSARGGLVIW